MRANEREREAGDGHTAKPISRNVQSSTDQAVLMALPSTARHTDRQETQVEMMRWGLLEITVVKLETHQGNPNRLVGVTVAA